MRYMRNTAGRCPACERSQRMSSGSAAPPRAACPVQCSELPVMAFIQPQEWDCTYSCGQALVRGTLFPALDKPFMGKGGCCNG